MPRGTTKTPMERPVRRAPLGARWNCCSGSALHDGGLPGRTGLRTHRPRRSSRHLLTVASQARYRPSAFLTAFVPAHRCGAAPESHRVPLTDARAIGRCGVRAQRDCSTTRHLRRAITTTPAAIGRSAIASPPPHPDAFRMGVGTQRPFVHARPRSQSLEDRHGSRISFSSEVMSGPPMPAEASGIDASRAKACSAPRTARPKSVRFIESKRTSSPSNVDRTTRPWAV